jgi:hypothetical protein
MFSKLSGSSKLGGKKEAAEPLVIVPMPSLLSILVALEDKKSEPLTESEVLKARDGAVSVALPLSVAQKVAKERGYEDIDPDRVWEEWKLYRAGKS